MKILYPLFSILFFGIAASAQFSFKYFPEKPQPGDSIFFTYTPGGDLMGKMEVPQAIAYQMGGKSIADDIVIKRNRGSFTGAIKTDTASNFVYFGFSIGELNDNNRNEGFFITLYDNEKPRKGAYSNLADFYDYFGERVGVEANANKALKAFEKEMELYPETRKNRLILYINYLNAVDKDKAKETIGKEIEELLKDTLKEADYTTLYSLFRIGKMPQQAKFFDNIRKEKFPNGTWRIGEQINNFYDEEDLDKKLSLLQEIDYNIQTKPEWERQKQNLVYYYQNATLALLSARKWEEAKALIAQTKYEDDFQRVNFYQPLINKIINDSMGNIPFAEALAEQAVTIVRNAKKNPLALKPISSSMSQWEKSIQNYLGSAFHNYAKVLSKKQEVKKAFSYAKEAAITIGEGKNMDYNTTYAKIAQKQLAPRKLEKELAGFVKEGKAGADVKDIFRQTYIALNKTDKGFDSYLEQLEKESYLKMVAELKKKIINMPAPTFTLYNLNGEKIDLASYKGKVVVVDFWATWCGPCISSFPGMQKTQDKYKNDPDVKFLFVNTWQSEEDKKQNAADFIAKNGYTFDVPLDLEDKVVADYQVDGIPTKFIIDKEGNIRFKSVGFDGNTDRLVQELSAMIEQAAGREVN